MEYLRGQIIKPDRTLDTGQVIFTNGEAPCEANQQTCIAYGYEWDSNSNTCMAFRPTSFVNLMTATLKIGNKLNGIRNEVKEGAFNNDINGVDNTIGEGVQNSVISGKGNVIDKGIHNASVSGAYGKAQRQHEIVLGGGNYAQAVNYNGYSQSSTLQCSIITNGSGSFIATVGGNPYVSNNLIPVQTHSVIVFKLTGIAIDTVGGANWSFFSKWVVQMDNNRQATYCNADSGLDCGGIPEGWTMPYFNQMGGGEYDWGDLELRVAGVSEMEIMYNIKLELLETRNLTDY
tara:strand:+ start:3816 stop:4682 length:867 start_codon:yes stop_codon:yes gene_type:complete